MAGELFGAVAVSIFMAGAVAVSIFMAGAKMGEIAMILADALCGAVATSLLCGRRFGDIGVILVGLFRGRCSKWCGCNVTCHVFLRNIW